MFKTKTLSDKQLLEGLARSDSKAVEQIYRMVLPGVVQYVRKNSGSETDARDIFQEAMIVMYRKASEGQLELTCTLNTFISSICRKLWLNRLRGSQREMGMIEGMDYVDPDEDTLLSMVKTSKYRLFQSHFKRLGSQCQQILDMFFQKTSMKEIAQKMGSTEGYIKKRKFKCKEKLIQSIKKDNRFKELQT
jgi:RNA polymerase sigma factor (sigma-70 family)